MKKIFVAFLALFIFKITFAIQTILIAIMKTQENSLQQLPELYNFEIAETSILACRATIGELVAIKPVVENLQLNWGNEFRKLKSYYTHSQLLYAKSLSADGKYREMVCLSVGDFNEWLWRLDPKGEDADLDLLAKYRKLFVLQLMLMLKVSLDEVERLRHIEENFNELLERQRQYFRVVQEQESFKAQARERAKQLNQESAQRRELLKEVVFRDPNQLHLFLHLNDQ